MDNSTGMGVTVHTVSKRLPGDMALVRQHMIDALESFKYMILSGEPLYAKRDGAFSMNVLGCALNNAGDSRFCRGCGAPNAGSLAAELEVMRLTAGARAGQQTIVAGAIILLSILSIALPLIFLGRAKRETIGWVLLILGQVTGWAILLYGILRLHRTLNPKITTEPLPLLNVTRTLPSFEPAALPPQSARASVTEGTTELLEFQPRKQRAIPVERASADTGEMKQGPS